MITHTKIPFIQGAILSCAVLLTAPAHADTEAMLDLLEVLRDRGTISQDEFATLRHAAKTHEEKILEVEEEKEGFEAKTGYAGLTVESTDGAFEFNVGGRLHIDANFFDEDI